jgi:hypothetical protein
MFNPCNLNHLCSSWIATPTPGIIPATYFYVDQTISSPYEGLCASTRLSVLPFGIVVAPSLFLELGSELSSTLR